MYKPGIRYIFLLLLTLSGLCCHYIADAQKITAFQRSYGGKKDDWGASIVKLADNGYIVSGRSDSYSANGNNDILLIRTDSLGKVIWSKCYGGTADEGVLYYPTNGNVDVILAPDSNIVVCSTTESYGAGGRDVYFFKVNLNGNVMWNHTYGGKADDEGFKVVSDPSGGYVIAGETFSYGAGKGDVLLIKTDTAGKLVWSKTYGTSYNEECAFGVSSILGGNFLIYGYSHSANTTYDQLVLKVDKNGKLIWSKIYGTTSYDNADCAIELPDKSIYLSGFTYNQFNGENTMALITKLDSNGRMQWSKMYDQNNHSSVNCMYYDQKKNILNAAISIFQGGTQQEGFIRLDTSGNIKFLRTFGRYSPTLGYSSGFGHNFLPLASGGFILEATTLAFGFGGWDYYFLKLDSIGNPSDCQIHNISLTPAYFTSYLSNYSNVFASSSISPNVGSGMAVQTVTVGDSLICAPFVAGFSSETICLVQATPFFDSSYYEPTSWIWNFGDPGSTTNTSTLQNPTHIYSSPGTYTVKLVSGNGSTTDSIRHVIKVLPRYSNLKKTTTPFCLGDSINLVASGTKGVKFSWIPKSLLSNANDSSVWAHPVTDTIFVVKVTNNEGCTTADSFIVKLDNLSHAKTITTSFCKGDSINLSAQVTGGIKFSWSPAALLSDSTDYSVQAHPNGNTTFVVKITNSTGCMTSDSFIVKLAVLSHAKTVTTSFCPGDSLNLEVVRSGGGKFSWSPGLLVSDSTDSSVWAHPKMDTTFIVTIANSTGCTIADSFIVKLVHLSPINLGGNKSSCLTPIELSPGQYPGLTYLWSTGENSDSIYVNQSGKYWVRVNKRGCNASDTAIVTILSPAVFQNDNIQNTLFCSDDSDLTLDAGAGYRYLWSPGGDTTQKIQVSTTGTYTVQITAPDGCVASKTVSITNQCTTYLFVANAFTPNGDKLNDQFKPVSRYPLESYNMKIYNRWGERLFQSSDINIGWNGTFKSQLCPEDVYLYIILYKFPYEIEQIKSGTVTLLR